MSAGRAGGSTAKPLMDDLPSPRFPPPPRAPSFLPGGRSESGTRPRPAQEPSHITAPSGVTVPEQPAFPAQESPSFDKRLTPVVPANWPDEEAATGSYARPLPEAPQAPTPAQDSASVSVAPAQSSASVSLTPAAGDEHAFWNAAPRYSVAPAKLVTDPPAPRPSRVRTSLTRLLFVTITGIVLALLYYEAAIAYHVPWQNPRLLMQRLHLG